MNERANGALELTKRVKLGSGSHFVLDIIYTVLSLRSYFYLKTPEFSIICLYVCITDFIQFGMKVLDTIL